MKIIMVKGVPEHNIKKGDAGEVIMKTPHSAGSDGYVYTIRFTKDNLFVGVHTIENSELFIEDK